MRSRRVRDIPLPGAVAGLLAAGLLTALPLTAACGPSGESGAVTVRRDSVGDTLVLTSEGSPDTVAVDDVRVLWRSPELGNPRVMALARAAAGEVLVVGDGTRVHLLRLGGDSVVATTVGRAGEGPGEFRSIFAVGDFGAEGLAVYDAVNGRLTYLTAAGELLGSDRVSRYSTYHNTDRPQRLIPWRDGFLWYADSGARLGERVRRALLWHDPAADTARVLREWPGWTLTRLGGDYVGPRRMYGASAHVSVGPGPTVASGGGREYCVTLEDLGAAARLRRLCRERPRTPAGEGLRSPDLGVLEGDEDALGYVRAHLEHQEVPDRLPSFDRVLLGQEGELWVRTVGPALADVPPALRRERPALGPRHRHWDVFDAGSGRLLRTLRLPSRFEPWAVTGERAYGFYELPTGEITIGEWRFPASIRDGHPRGRPADP